MSDGEGSRVEEMENGGGADGTVDGGVGTEDGLIVFCVESLGVSGLKHCPEHNTIHLSLLAVSESAISLRGSEDWSHVLVPFSSPSAGRARRGNSQHSRAEVLWSGCVKRASSRPAAPR